MHLVLVCRRFQQERQQILIPAFRKLTLLNLNASELRKIILECRDIFLCNRIGAFLVEIGSSKVLG